MPDPWTEAHILINGVELTAAQSLTLRVALEHFANDLQTAGLGEDERGQAICANYLAQIDAIRQILYC